MSKSLVVATAVLVLSVALVPATGGATDAAVPGPRVDAPADIASASDPLASNGSPSTPQTDTTVTRIELYENGSARWVVRIRTRLTTDAELTDYRAFQERFRENTSRYLTPFRERIEATVAGARNATGREMSATNFRATTGIQQVPRRWGVVTFSFTWRDFAATRDDRLVVGDVFEGGFYLAADDTLKVVTPPGFAVAGASPQPDGSEEGILTWTGPHNFADGRPSVSFAGRTAAGTTASSDRGTAGTTGDGATTGGTTTAAGAASTRGVPAAPLAGALLLAAGIALVVVRRRGATGADTSNDPEDDVTETGDRDVDDPTTPEEAAASANSGEKTGATVTEFRSDEDRAATVIRDHGGTIKQKSLAEALEWSPSKTSRVVSSLEESGRVEKLRIGRENVLELVSDDE